MKLLVSILLLPNFLFSQTKLDFSLIIESPNKSISKLILEFKCFSENKTTIKKDTLIANHQSLTFGGEITEPDEALLYIETSPGNISKHPFFLVPGRSIIDLSSITPLLFIKNCAANNLFKNLLLLENSYNSIKDSRIETLISLDLTNEQFESHLNSFSDTLKLIRINLYTHFYKQVFNSQIGFYTLKKLIAAGQNKKDSLEYYFSMLPESSKLYPSAIQFKNDIDSSKNTLPGKFLPNFNLLDTSGNNVFISKVVQRLTLIDFWASWCIPCRRQSPLLRNLYEKYKNTEFQIIGIALEKEGNAKNWLKAIKDDNLPGLQLTDFKFWDSPITKRLGITSIPFNLLIDQNSKIIASNLSFIELETIINKLQK